MKKIVAASSVLLMMIFISPVSFGLEKGSARLDRVVFSTPSTQSMSSIAFGLGQKNGFYRGEGIDFELILGMKSVLILAGVKSGGIDYAGTAGDTIRSAATGFPIKLIFVTTSKLPHSLMSKPEIKSMKELKGKILGVSSLGSSEHFAARKLLQEFGLDPSKDVTIVGSGHGMGLVALSAGSVDAAMMSSSFIVPSKRKGFRELVVLGDYVELPSIGIATSPKKIKENRPQAKKVIKATIKSMQYIHDHKNEAVDFLVKEWGLDRDVAGLSYNREIKIYTFGHVSEKGVQNHIELGKELGMIKGDVPISQVLDLSLLREAEKEMGISQ